MNKRLRYERRYHYAKAQGISTPPAGGRKRPWESALWSLPDIAEEALTCCGIPGPALLHCGTWQAILALPHVCTACGARFFEETAA